MEYTDKLLNDSKKKENFLDVFAKRKIKLPVRITVASIMVICVVLQLVLYTIVRDPNMKENNLFSYSLNLSAQYIMLILSIGFAFDTSPTDNGSFWFFILFIFVFLGAFTNCSSLIFEDIPKFALLNKISAFICCIASPIGCFALCCYQYSLMEKRSKVVDIYMMVIFILGIIDCISFIVNLKFGYFYSIDENSHYIVGNMYALYLVYPMLSFVSSMIITRHIFALEQKKTGILLICSIAGLLIASILTNADYSYSFFTFSLIILLIYVSVQANRGKEIAKKNEMIAHQAMDLVKQEQQIMISQINPHFIYNTLSTIECLCETDPKLAVKTVENFSSYLRTNVDTLTKVETVEFEKELKHVGHYVEIEMLRFPNIKINYEINDTNFFIPALTIQPMVENAIRYGVRAKEEGIITVRSYYQDMTHIVEIEDNGCGFDVNAPKKKDGRGHIGIENVKSRLEKMVNGDLFIVSKIGSGTKVTISIPERKEN